MDKGKKVMDKGKKIMTDEELLEDMDINKRKSRGSPERLRRLQRDTYLSDAHRQVQNHTEDPLPTIHECNYLYKEGCVILELSSSKSASSIFTTTFIRVIVEQQRFLQMRLKNTLVQGILVQENLHGEYFAIPYIRIFRQIWITLRLRI